MALGYGIKDVFKIQGLPNGRMSLPLMDTGKLGRTGVGRVKSSVLSLIGLRCLSVTSHWQLGHIRLDV